MSLFAEMESIKDVELLEEHEFPLFEFTGLYQKFYLAREAMLGECIVVNLRQAAHKSDEEILNLVLASGYVREDADLNFRVDAQKHYMYVYFHLCQAGVHALESASSDQPAV